MSIRTADQILFLFSLVAPIYLIARFRWSGFWLGIVTAWWTLVAAGMLLELAPDRGPSAIDGIWLLFG